MARKRGGLTGGGAGAVVRIGARVALVQVERPDGDNVEVVVEFACLGGESEVCDGRDFEVGDLKAGGPFVFRLVGELKLEILVLEVGQATLGGDVGVADAACLRFVSYSSGCSVELRRTEQPATSLALPSLFLSYFVLPSPFMAMM